MSQNVVSYTDVVPRPLRIAPLITGSGRVARKTKREFLPSAGSRFSFERNSTIEFKISSTKELLIMNECYVRFKLNVKATSTSGATVFQDHGARFTEIGAHALFRRLELLDRADRVIDVVDYYDHVTQIMNSVYKDRSVATTTNFVSGMDSISPLQRIDINDVAAFSPSNYNFDHVLGRTGTISTTAGSQTVTGTQTKFSSKLLGRYMAIVENNRIVQISKVYEVVSQTELKIGENANETLVGATYDFIEFPSRVGYDETREFTIRLTSGLFDMPSDLPLFLMDGLNIKLYLNQPENPFMLSNTQGEKSVAYELTDVRFMCNLRLPSSEIRDQYVEMYDKAGLNYPFKSTFVIPKELAGNSGGRLDLDLAVSKSSLTKVFMVLQTDVERGTTVSPIAETDSFIANSYRYANLGLRSFQFKIGAEDYPNFPIIIPDTYAADAYTELLIAAGAVPGIRKETNITFAEWAANGSSYVLDGGLTNQFRPEPHKRIYATRFDTVEDDIMSGIRTRGIGTDANITVILTFLDEQNSETDVSGNVYIGRNPDDPDDYVESQRYILFVFEHGKVLHVSRKGIMTFD